MEKKADRRTLKTKKAICDAFAELLTEKDLHKITVQEIADKADINRVTFYKHYLDVYDLYDKVEEEVLIELGLLILQLNEQRDAAFYSCLIEYIFEHKSIFKMMFSPNGTNRLRDKFGKLMEGIFRTLICEQQELAPSDETVGYFSCYRAQGCIALVEKWVRNDLADTKDNIIQVFMKLDQNTAKLMVKA
ncbi:MAG: TetR/AcrR family transcriptional regulator [Oscillospiraceae bacterium]|nr:TetR/AcrR family transcriptional regulator [Oscillospiraceae bacterium]